MAALTVLQRRATLTRPVFLKNRFCFLLFVFFQNSGLSEKLVQQLSLHIPPHQNMSLTNTKTGFSVKDILDLPDTNDEEGSITGAEEDTEGSETTSTTKTTGVLVQSPLENAQNLPLKNPFYDSSDNPYTRWLATTDSIQYSCK